MLDFKKLAEVTSTEDLPEGANVLVNDDGVVKQVPANKVGEMVPDALKKAAESGDGFGYTDGNELHQIDSKYIKKEELVPEEVAYAVENNGLGSEGQIEIPAIDISWDGKKEEYWYIFGDYYSGDYYWISDAIDSYEKLLGTSFHKIVENSDPITVVATEDNIEKSSTVWCIEGVAVVSSEPIYNEDNDHYYPAGLYLYSDGQPHSSVTPANYVDNVSREAITKTKPIPIARQYLPESIKTRQLKVEPEYSEELNSREKSVTIYSDHINGTSEDTYEYFDIRGERIWGRNGDDQAPEYYLGNDKIKFGYDCMMKKYCMVERDYIEFVDDDTGNDNPYSLKISSKGISYTSEEGNEPVFKSWVEILGITTE